MANTFNLGVTLVEQSQTQKEVTVNEALVRIDALLNTGAKSRALSAPPDSPSAGDVYIIGASPTGDWQNHAQDITYFDQVWRFISPNVGASLWVSDENVQYTYSTQGWIKTGINALLNATTLSSILSTDFIPVVRENTIYLATIADCLNAGAPAVSGGQFLFNNAGNSGLLAGVL